MIEQILTTIKQYAAQLAAAWVGLSRPRKIVLAASGVLVFAAVWTFRATMSEQAFRPLYTGLNDEEAGAAVVRLQEMEVPYRLAAGGGTILVPQSRLPEVRLQLASDGLPRRGRIGFEVFDQSSFGATEFAEQVNFRRALEGELERSIVSLDEVERCRVHVSLPKRSVFLDHEEAAKASVVVQLRPNARLGKAQIDSISYLVASAVEGLDPRKIVVIDTSGRLLARPISEDETFSTEQLEHKRKVEGEIVRNILATIEPLVGFDKVRASVAAEFDWNSGEQTEEVIDPNSVIITSQKSEEITSPMIESGPPGTESNLPRQPAQPRVRRGGSSRTMETTNYQTSRTVTKTRIEPGTVKRLSVAVIVDQRLEWDEEAGRAVRRPRSAEQMEKIRGLVIAAAGIVAERGDLVTTESLPFTIFEPPPQAPAEPVIPPLDPFTLDWLRRYQHYFISTVAGLLLLAAAAAGLRYWLRGRTAARAESQKLFAEDEERRTLIEAENEEKRIRAEENRLLQGLKMATVQTGRAQILKRYIEESAGKDPIAFVQLLRAWIHEDD